MCPMTQSLSTLCSSALIAFCAMLPHAASAEPPVIENSIGMKLVRIPAGEFMMGSDESPASLTQAYPGYPPPNRTDL